MPILLVAPDPEWPQIFRREAASIRSVLGSRVLCLEHTGSTSVPGLAAKPVIDILLVVADSSDEDAYLCPLWYPPAHSLRIREPAWYEHRMFNGPHADINLHVFTSGCPEIDRMLMFRDWLRGNAADRHLYERAKLALAHRDWKSIQDYADAKSAVVSEIIGRARLGS